MPKCGSVHYPFLKSHPQYAVAREQMSGGGGMVSFEVEGTGEDARRVTRIAAAVHAGAEPGRSGVAGVDPGADVACYDLGRGARRRWASPNR